VVASSARPDVTVCIPAFESEAFVGDCLEALSRQTYDGFAALVSVDASGDATEAVCRSFESDSRFRVNAQPRRLGWVENINSLLDRVETDLFFILPHDDLLEPDYVESLRVAMLDAPKAVVAYADVRTFGAVDERQATPGLEAGLVDRVLALLTSQLEGVPFRGLTRSALLNGGLRLRDNRHAGFGAHIVWVLELLCRGPFRHVSRPLYRQNVRSDPASVVQGWDRRAPENRLAAWAEHSAACLEVLARTDASNADRLRLQLVQLARALMQGDRGSPGWDVDDPAVRRELVLLAALTARGLGLPEVEGTDLVALPAEAQLWEAIARLEGS